MRTRLRHVVLASALAVTSVASIALSATPVSAAPFTYTSVSTGYHRTCAVTTDGIGLCWGWNHSGSLGTSDRASIVLTPSVVALPAGERFASIEAGSYFSSCGLTESGNVYCWGESAAPSRLRLPADTVVTQISVGGSQVCALTDDHLLYCHGDWHSGELGVGEAEYSHLPVRVTLPDAAEPAYVSAGIGFTCVVTTAGAAYCTGINAAGQLGNGTTSGSKVFVSVDLPETVRLTSISAGLERACALDTKGGGWCWGENYYGAFGDDTYTDSRTPRPVALDNGIALADLRTGWYHTCARATTGRALCWGSNDQGALGWGETYGGKTIRSVALPKDVSVATLTTGLGGTCITSTNGRLFCWGSNLYGSVGNGSTRSAFSPEEVLSVGTPDPTLPDVSAASTRTANISGTFVPNGATTSVTIRIASNASLTGARSIAVTIPHTRQSTLEQLHQPVAYSASVNDLLPATTYFVVVRTTNSFGTSDSPVATFTTLGGIPTIGSLDASNVGGDAATIDVVVDPNLLDTTITATYSTDPRFAAGLSTSVLGVARGDAETALSATLTSLASRTRYWLRITASNEAGSTTSEVISFTTIGDAPSTLVAVANAGRRRGSVSVSLDAGQLRTIVTVAHRIKEPRGRWTSQALEVSGGAATAEFQFEGLEPATTYEIQVSAINAAGSNELPLVAFTTAGGAPFADEVKIGAIGETTATLRTTVDSNDFATRVTLQIDTDGSFTNYDEWFAGMLIAGSASTISLDISDLVDSTVYFARFVATNSKGVGVSDTLSFTTTTPVGKLLKRRVDPVDPVPVVEPTPVATVQPLLTKGSVVRLVSVDSNRTTKALTKTSVKTATKPKSTKRATAKKRTTKRQTPNPTRNSDNSAPSPNTSAPAASASSRVIRLHKASSSN